MLLRSCWPVGSEKWLADPSIPQVTPVAGCAGHFADTCSLICDRWDIQASRYAKHVWRQNLFKSTNSNAAAIADAI